jgi:5-methylcytosine-specific restriction endonuclease McrA
MTDDIVTEKTCNRCGELKPLTGFYRQHTAKDGHAATCKPCKKLPSSARRYGAKKYDEQGNKWCPSCRSYKPLTGFGLLKSRVDGHKPKCRACEAATARTRAAKDPTKRREAVKRYRLRHLEEMKERRRRDYEENKEREREWHRRYCERNRGIQQIRRSKRRARILANGDSLTLEEWNEIQARWGHACLCCGRCAPEIKLTVDHVLPLSKGGSNAAHNIQPLCGSCNSRKKDKHIDYRPNQEMRRHI